MGMIQPETASVAKWYHRWFRTPAELRDLGVVGINMRNARFLLPNNPRRLYELVDNKLRTKALAEAEGMCVAETYGVLRTPHDANIVEKILKGNEAFVIKPTRGSGGKGIMVIDKKVGKNYIKPSGAEVTPADVKNHVSNILAGLFSLGGKRDYALIEYRVQPAKLLTDLSFQGAPDIRVVMLHGYPVMAMLRASTKESDGRSNLHQGALGIGVDIATGMTVLGHPPWQAGHGTSRSRRGPGRHPDTRVGHHSSHGGHLSGNDRPGLPGSRYHDR